MEVDDGALAARLNPSLGDRVQSRGAAFDDSIEEEVEPSANQRSTSPAGAGSPLPHAGAGRDRPRRGAAAAGGKKSAQQRWRTWRCSRGRRGQIRLRNLTGAILVDFAGMTATRRRTLAPSLTPRSRTIRCGRGCSASPRSVWPKSSGDACIRHCTSCSPVRMPRGWRRFAELRQRCASQPQRMPVAACVARPSWRRCKADAEALPDLARRAGRALILRSDPTLPSTGWALETQHD